MAEEGASAEGVCSREVDLLCLLVSLGEVFGVLGRWTCGSGGTNDVMCRAYSSRALCTAAVAECPMAAKKSMLQGALGEAYGKAVLGGKLELLHPCKIVVGDLRISGSQVHVAQL